MSNFSFLRGASHPDELVERAWVLGYDALAITDRATLAGIVRAHAAAQFRGGPPAAAERAGGSSPAAGFKLIVGAHLEPVDASPLVVWAADQRGYVNLCRLLTRGYARAEGDLAAEASGRSVDAGDREPVACRLTFDDIACHAGGLLAGVPLAAITPAPGGIADRGHADRGHADRGHADRGHGACSPAHPDWQRILVEHLTHWRMVFGERLWALAEVARAGDDADRLECFGRVARLAGVPVVAAGDIRYHERSRLPLADVLAAVRRRATVDGIRGELLTNGERHLHERWRIAERFACLPGAVERSVEIAARCTFTLDELRYEYPEAIVPAAEPPQVQGSIPCGGAPAAGHLARLTWKGARQRYPRGVPEKVRALIEHELALVTELGYEAYFLTVFDIVRFARRRGILCQGRGSAANSCICYCLGITSVDPARMNVLFERFVSRERREAPDIDVDFEHQRREEVIQYVYKTYGRDRPLEDRGAALTAEVIRYRLRSAVRDVAKSLGLSLDRVERIAEVLDVGDDVDDLPRRLIEAGLDPDDATATRLVTLVGQLIGFPRHLGQHVGGLVMTKGPLTELVPIQPATMAGRTIIQWDKNDLDELGILKVDCLALGMLTCIRRAFDLVAEAGGARLTLATVPAEDPAVYEMISRADTVGVFQIESRAQMSMLPRLQPRCFYDLVIEVAIVRPGPIQGNMVHPYLRRRAGEEPVTYPNDEIRAVLEKTLGVPLFQEQAMRLAVVAAGFTPGEADQLRRAMGAWRRPGVIDEFHRKLVDGMLARGLSREFAEQVFAQIRGFGEYGFPESHAASFALLVYVSAWLKCHHPAAFTAALLGSQPMGFYAPAQLVRDARAHGVRVLPVDVNASGWHASLETSDESYRPQGRRSLETSEGLETSDGSYRPHAGQRSLPPGRTVHAAGPAIRLGLEQVYGLGEAAGQRIEAARRDGPFRLPRDLVRRAGLGRDELLHLARAGALKSLGLDRRRAVWEAMQCQDRPGSRPLLEHLGDESDDDGGVGEDLLGGSQAGDSDAEGSRIGNVENREDGDGCEAESGWARGTAIAEDAPKDAEKGVLAFLPPLSPQEEVIADYRTGGLSLTAHPLEFERTRLVADGIVTAATAMAAPEGRRVRVVGIVLTRQRPATAKGMLFLTVEDETGSVNVVVRPDVWQAADHAARRAAVLRIEGRIQRRGAVVHLLATRIDAAGARATASGGGASVLVGLPRMSRDFC
jgi:error-prone DNA polymerase